MPFIILAVTRSQSQHHRRPSQGPIHTTFSVLQQNEQLLTLLRSNEWGEHSAMTLFGEGSHGAGQVSGAVQYEERGG